MAVLKGPKGRAGPAGAGPARTPKSRASFESIDGVLQALQAHGYIADRGLATAIFLALRLAKPLFLEGEAGVGKTEVARVLAAALKTRLIRLQCYEGIDVNHAVYEWNYARQMLYLRTIDSGTDRKAALTEIYGSEFLIKRPLLQAIDHELPTPPVLLIDEIDRSDDEFEAFLLEVLSEFQISIPETGTISAATPPVVVVTSNRTRELHDALKRRCLYHWIELPDVEKEFQIIMAKLPHVPAELGRQIAAFMAELRAVDLYKVPGVAETLDWARALLAMGEAEVVVETAEATLGCLLKHQEDLALVRGAKLEDLIGRAKSA